MVEVCTGVEALAPPLVGLGQWTTATMVCLVVGHPVACFLLLEPTRGRMTKQLELFSTRYRKIARVAMIIAQFSCQA